MGRPGSGRGCMPSDAALGLSCGALAERGPLRTEVETRGCCAGAGPGAPGRGPPRAMRDAPCGVIMTPLPPPGAAPAESAGGGGGPPCIGPGAIGCLWPGCGTAGPGGGGGDPGSEAPPFCLGRARRISGMRNPPTTRSE
jgi:hypothetical protein